MLGESPRALVRVGSSITGRRKNLTAATVGFVSI
jgi:hypothetical protein